MTQISAMLSANSSLVTNLSSEDGLLINIGLVGIALAVIALIISYTSKSKKKYAIFAVLYVLLGVVSFIVMIFGLIVGYSAIHRVDEQSAESISQKVKEKYGVTLLDNHDLISYDKNEAMGSHKFKLNRSNISASNAAGERIQITLELANDNTDVLAFSSGTEIKKINESAPKS